MPRSQVLTGEEPGPRNARFKQAAAQEEPEILVVVDDQGVAAGILQFGHGDTRVLPGSEPDASDRPGNLRFPRKGIG